MFYGFLSGYFLTKIAFPDIDILHPAVLSIPPKTMCLYNYYIAYVREGTILKVGVISEQQETPAIWSFKIYVCPVQLHQDPAEMGAGHERRWH